MDQKMFATIDCCAAVRLLLAVHSLLHTLEEQIRPGPLAVLAGFTVFWLESAFCLVEKRVFTVATVVLSVQQADLTLMRRKRELEDHPPKDPGNIYC